jgi:hypothetical protein
MRSSAYSLKIRIQDFVCFNRSGYILRREYVTFTREFTRIYNLEWLYCFEITYFQFACYALMITSPSNGKIQPIRALFRALISPKGFGQLRCSFNCANKLQFRRTYIAGRTQERLQLRL